MGVFRSNDSSPPPAGHGAERPHGILVRGSGASKCPVPFFALALDCARRVRFLALRHVVLSLFSCRERLVPPPGGDPRLRGRAWRARCLDAGATRDDRNDVFRTDASGDDARARRGGRVRVSGDAARRDAARLRGSISRDARLRLGRRPPPTPRPRSTRPAGLIERQVVGRVDASLHKPKHARDILFFFKASRSRGVAPALTVASLSLRHLDRLLSSSQTAALATVANRTHAAIVARSPSVLTPGFAASAARGITTEALRPLDSFERRHNSASKADEAAVSYTHLTLPTICSV